MIGRSNTAKTILYLNDTHNVPGGGEYLAMSLFRAAKAAGLESYLACISGSRTEAYFRAGGAETIGLPSLRRNPLLAVAQIKKIGRAKSIDLIHTNSFLTNFSGRLAGRSLGVPVVTSVLCEPDSVLLAKPGLRGRLDYLCRRAVDRRMSGYSNAFIAVSQAVANKLISEGAAPSKVSIIYNGIDAERVRRSAQTGAAPARRTDPNEFLVGVTARLDPIKGLDLLIRAVARLNQRGRLVRAVIIGEGQERVNLERLTAQLGLKDKIILTGYLESSYPQMAAVDAYVLPSLSEGLNITLLEAMALGRPVVATNAGGNPELVKDGESGLLVGSADVEALAQGIEALAGDEALRRRLVEGGQKMLDRFTVAAMCDQTISLYRRLLSGDS